MVYVRPHPNPLLEGEEDVPLTPYEREWSEGKKNLKFAGGSPAAGNFLLRRQKKVTKENATPVRCSFGVPCAARPSGRLCNSRSALRQCSPSSPACVALLGSSQGIQTNPSLSRGERVGMMRNLLQQRNNH